MTNYLLHYRLSSKKEQEQDFRDILGPSLTSRKSKVLDVGGCILSLSYLLNRKAYLIFIYHYRLHT